MAQPYIPIRRSAYNYWVPQTNRTHNDFILRLVGSQPDISSDVDAAIKAFNDAVSQEQKDLFTSALRQVGKYYAKWADPDSVVGNWDDFLNLLRKILAGPPPFYKAEIDDGVIIGEPIGVPIYLILDLVSNTSAAYTLFTDETFNSPLKTLLNFWGSYLAGTDNGSNGTLNKDGWFSEQGLVVLQSGLGKWNFWQTYEVDITDEKGLPKEPYYNSWDSFFTRQFKPKNPDGGDIRPIEASSTRIFINNACESTVLRTATDVQLNDTFWLKEQNYSIYDILGGSEDGSLADKYGGCFEGGSVYQAFLSPADFHRWHSPVKGSIVASSVLGGTYYAVLPDHGAPPYDPDLVTGDPHGALIRSQPWLSVAATRAVYVIKPDPSLHLKAVALVGIGMAEVSTCEIRSDILEKNKAGTAVDVAVGEEIGMFHFGGSSHTLLLKPEDGYEIIFQDYNETPIRTGQHRWINSAIAQIRAIPVKPINPVAPSVCSL